MNIDNAVITLLARQFTHRTCKKARHNDNIRIQISSKQVQRKQCLK